MVLIPGVGHPLLEPEAIRRAEKEEAERWGKLTEEERARERRRKRGLRKLSDFVAGALLLAILFALAVALIQWLFDFPALPAVVFSAILFLALWVWSVRNQVSDLRNKLAETDVDPTGQSARDGG